MTKFLSMASGKIWISTADPTTGEANVEQGNWIINTNSRALFLCSSITAGVQQWDNYLFGSSGILGLGSGGTNANLTASNGGIFYSTASAAAILPGTATANQVLLSGSSTTPAWSTATYPATTTVSQLLYSSSANVIAGLATANSGVLITSAGGVPSISSTLPSAVQGNITALGTISGAVTIQGILTQSSGQVVKVTTPGAYPYTALTSDFVIKVDTSSARGITLMSTPTTGQVLRIKDTVGSAAANNITITPAAGLIDAGATLVISSNYGSVDLIYTGSAWSVF